MLTKTGVTSRQRKRFVVIHSVQIVLYKPVRSSYIYREKTSENEKIEVTISERRASQLPSKNQATDFDSPK